MNTFDLLSQTLPRRPEGQPGRVPQSAATSPDPSAAGNFVSLLNSLSDARPQEGAPGEVPKTGGAAFLAVSDPEATGEMMIDPLGLEQDQTVEDLLQIFTPEMLPDANVSGHVGGSVLAVLQAFLPGVAAQDKSGQSGSTGSPGSLPVKPGQIAIGTDADASNLLQASERSALKIAVQHQETHFKPIIEGFSIKHEVGEARAADGLSRERLAPVVGGRFDDRQLAAPGGALHPSVITIEMDASSERQAGARELPQFQAAKSEAAQQAPELGSRLDGPPSLAPGMLHRIAGAVLTEARSVTGEPSMQMQRTDGRALLASTRAAEGVLRVLNLQLHPAELGVVTVRMRLAGSNLEMELEVSSDETAQLLRNDAEKLSGLLKGSGYRPDAITINVAPPEAQQSDSASSLRQQSQSQSQHQGSEHHGRSPQRNDERDNYRTEGVRHHESEGGAPAGSRTGGIYL